MKNFLKEFEKFIMRGNVIDMAVGVIVGAAFQGIVNSLVNDVISPLLGLAFVIFLLVKFINKIAELGNRKDKEKTPEEPAKPATKICPYCKSEIPADAVKCCHCTSDLAEKISETV